jgi:Prokaryotic N-terminal methylation motif
MRTRALIPSRRPRRATSRPPGFTLAELMITIVIFTMVIGGVVASNLFGMHMFTLTQIKLGNSDVSRRTIDWLIADVRGARSFRIGTGSLNSFTEIGTGQSQQGNAIQLYPLASTASYTRYYWDSSDQCIERITNGQRSPVLIASGVSNSVVFTAEDIRGNILTNNASHCVVGVTLQFSHLLFPTVGISTTNYYDFYQLQTKIARRTME